MKELEEQIEEIFNRYNDRKDVTTALQKLGFSLWAYTERPDGSKILDEEIWVYDVGTPNGQVLILINWIDCFAWIFKKERVIKI